MACFHPVTAYQTKHGEIVFNELRRHDIRRTLQLPCNQCIGCKAESSRQKAVRCLHEAKMHKQNCFITLTLNNENYKPSLDHRDWQLFMYRFRKAIRPIKIRFYMAGEYGDQLGRPHYHAIIFGYDFPDKKYFSGKGENTLYTSDMLTKLWGMGHASVGAVTFDSAAYVARYVMKKITGPLADFKIQTEGFPALSHYERLNHETGEIIRLMPEYNRFSTGGRTGAGGIGKTWFLKYHRDAYTFDYSVVKGKKVKNPAYYDKLFKRLDPDRMEEFKEEREIKARAAYLANNTPERLKVREEVLRAKFKLKKRKL